MEWLAVGGLGGWFGNIGVAAGSVEWLAVARDGETRDGVHGI